MLLELALGDAYGAGFEYASDMIQRHNDLTHFVKHPRHLIIPGSPARHLREWSLWTGICNQSG